MNIKYIDGVEYREVSCREGFYVSRAGVVLGLRDAPLKPKLYKRRLEVNLWSRRFQKPDLNKAVGDLVLTAFVCERPSKDHVVRHLNGDAENCDLDNIEWALDEINRADERGRSRPSKLGRRLTIDEVIDIKRLLAAGWSQMRVAVHYGVGRTCINDINTGYRWSHVTIPESLAA